VGGVNVERPQAKPLGAAARPGTYDIHADERRRIIAGVEDEVAVWLPRGGPLTNDGPEDAGAIEGTGIFPATAVPRRVVGSGSVHAQIDATLCGAGIDEAVISATVPC
jgi:hypothetical protein